MSPLDRSEKSYSSKDAAAKAGATYRQLDYWVRKGLIAPSIREAEGHGTRRRWSTMDVRRIRVIVKALEMGAVNPVRTLEGVQDLTIPSTGYVVVDLWTHRAKVIETRAAARKLAEKIGATALIIPIK